MFIIFAVNLKNAIRAGETASKPAHCKSLIKLFINEDVDLEKNLLLSLSKGI